ncbi:MAG: RHS repeat-associated core domain-containing protein, partial [Chloroflexota bacterium]
TNLSINIRAETVGNVNSLRFGVNDNPNYQLEELVPYMLAGDNPNTGVLNGWRPAPGVYTLTATAFSRDAAGGVASAPYTITVTVLPYSTNASISPEPFTIADNTLEEQTQHLTVTAMCDAMWRIENVSDANLAFEWRSANTFDSGSGMVQAGDSVYLTLASMRIDVYTSGQWHASASASMADCTETAPDNTGGSYINTQGMPMYAQAEPGTTTIRTIERHVDYTYDALSRLLEADYNEGSTVYTYGYDTAGNLVNKNGTTRTYNAANQMVNDGTNTLTYDQNGNLTNDGVDAYTWDRANRMLSVGTTTYAYDGAGNRIQQTVGSVVTDYLNDTQPGLTKLLAQTTGSDTQRFVHAPRGIHGSEDNAGNWHYYAQDGLGSVRGVLSDVAAVQASQSYDPYGDPLGSYGDGFGFTGEQTDANGQVYLRARYYNPQMGVFSALDQIEFTNRYWYADANPVNYTDPSGKCVFAGVDTAACYALGAKGTRIGGA